MTFVPLTTAPLLIQSHIVFAVIAIGLGPFVIHRNRRDRIHKWAGYVWIAAMLGLAISGAFIPAHGAVGIGPFGPIHAFVLLALWSIWSGMRAIYRRDIDQHRVALKSLYWQGLVIAGLFNFLPGRTINRSVFPEHQDAGWYVIAAGGTILLVLFLWQNGCIGRGAGVLGSRPSTRM